MSSEAINPFANAELWDVVQIGETTSPGICTVSGFKRTHGWEVKKGKGVKGSTITLNEFPPAEGTIKFLLWTPEHFVAWGAFRPLFKYDPTKKTVNAVDIFHPALDDIEVRRVVCKDIGQVEKEGPGLYSITVSLLEYNPPPKKNATSTPKASSNTSNSSGSGDPVLDAKLAEIDRLREEAKDPKPSQGLETLH